ncbi:MAG: DUF2975 domain-containing protein [Sediminibacterium sp.]
MIKRFKPTTGFIVVCLVVLSLLMIGIIMYRLEFTMIGEGSHTDIAELTKSEKLTHIDSLPYYQYKEITDSLKNIADNEKEKNTLYPMGLNINTGFIGVLQTFRYWYGWYGDDKSHHEIGYYISLQHYSLNQHFAFYFKDGKNYLYKWNGPTKEIQVAYLPKYETVLYPVSKQFYNVSRIVLYLVMIFISLALLYIFLALPINVLLNISRGKVFTLINLRDLHIIYYAAFSVFLVQMIMPYIVNLFFLQQIPAELSISFSKLFTSNWEMGLFGIITLVITRAFAKGYKLQQEQDLTI